MKTSKLKLFFLLFFVAVSIPSSKLVYAQSAGDSPCDSASYSALIQLPAGKYNTYTQAGRHEDSGLVRIYSQNFESQVCAEIGAGEVTEKGYKNIGQLDLTSETNLVSIFIVNNSDVNGTQAGASSPLVIFSETSTQPCDPETGCRVKYNDQEFVLSPKKISMSVDSIRIGLLEPYEIAIKEVIYSVDEKPVYTKSDLQEFNLNYVSDGEHTISRTIVLQDGQSLSDSRTIKRGLDGGFTYYFTSILFRQSILLRSMLLVALLVALLSFAVWLRQKLKYRKQWYKRHFVSVEKVDMSRAGFQTNFKNEEGVKDILIRHKKAIVISITVIACLLFTGNFVISFFTVDGVSMYPTLKDKSKQPLLILPVSIGRLNRNYYIPQRGAVVVVQKDDNNLFIESAEKTKHYVVKRVVGLPGERIVVRDGKIIVYNKQNIKGFEPDAEFNWVKDLTGSANMAMDITLKDGELFVVGDNRDESIDSRFYGPIKTSYIIGKVL